MVATDGHRLALAETDQKLAGLNGEVKVLIPKKAMDEVEKLASAAGSDASIEFAKDESHLFFQVGHRLLISRILTGQLPNYEAVLPRDNNKHVVLERVELSDAVRRVSQLADQRSHAVKLAVSKEGVEISASSPEYGEAKENIEKDYKGDPSAIGFNSSYMLDFLSAAADGPVSIELKDEQSAGQMRLFFFKQKTAYEIGLGIPAEPLFRSALHTKRQNLFQELDAVIHLLMEAKHWGLRKSRNATSLNSRFKSLDTLKVKIISVTFRRVIRTNHKKASKIWRHENIQLGGCQS